MSEDARTRGLALATLPQPADRDRAIDLLSDGFARGQLELDEFESRVTKAHAARSLADLDGLTRDLAPAAAAPAPAPATTRALVPAGEVKPDGVVLSIMGEARRKGAWRVPRKLRVVAVMGGTRLDFREALLPAGEVVLDVVSVMGGVEIIVPPHLAVESEGAGVMGGFEDMTRVAPNLGADATVLRIRGIAVMGGVQIETRLPGESGKEARKRQRRERKRTRDED